MAYSITLSEIFDKISKRLDATNSALAVDDLLAWLGDEAIGSDADSEFDRWLNNVCAEVWAEGHGAGFADGVNPDDHITPNPYRRDRA